jgi:hypothetical protein
MLGGRWFRWAEIEACFWPGPGGRSSSINPELAVIKDEGGVYLLAWSQTEPQRINPQEARHVKYIGQTHCFKDRMGGFAWSAGFWGERSFGHSAGWRWPEGKNKLLWVAFFSMYDEQPHLACGLRCWMEAVAMEEYRVKHRAIPQVNGTKRGEVAVF